MTTKIGTATDYMDVLYQLAAVLAVGTAFAKTYDGAGNGDIANGYAGGASSVAETFTITATSATEFSVVGTDAGDIGTAEVGTQFTHGRITFKIVAGATPFSVGDAFTLTTAPPWQRVRWGGRNSLTQIFGTWASAQNAFDTQPTQTYASGPLPANLGIHFPTAIEVREVAMQAEQDYTKAPVAFALEYSDDGAAWSVAQNFVAAWSISGQRQRFAVAVAPGAHLHWRIRPTALLGGQSECRIGDIGLYPSQGHGQDYTKRFEAAWIAPGNGGQEQIPIQAYTYEDRTTGCYNLVLQASLTYSDTATIEAQLTSSGARCIPLWQSATPYWIVANGGCFKFAARVSTIYTGGGAGAFRAWDTPDVYPRPWFVAGITDTVALPWTSRTANARTMQDPGRYGFMALWPDSIWRDVSNRYDSGSGDDGNAAGTQRQMWPASYDLSGNLRNNFRENLDGSFPLVQCVIVSTAPMGDLGELDGVFWTPGANNAPERLQREGGFDHLVLTNLFRSQPQNFWALRLD